MMTKSRTAVVAASVVAVAALVGGALAIASDDDPRNRVSAITVDGIDVENSAVSDEQRSKQIAGLDTLTGTLDRQDRDDFVVGGIDVEFGPDEWLRTAGPSEDFDGNGTAEPLLKELEGLVGTEITAKVRLDDDGDDADVYVLNGLDYRDTAGGPAPWQLSGTGSTPAASTGEVSSAAARAVGSGARVEDLDRESAGDVAWNAEVIDADGREHTVLLDIGGKVLDVQLDD